MRLSLSLLAFFISISVFAQYDAERYPVIPKPYKLLPFGGEFTLNDYTVLVTDNKNYRDEIEYFRQRVKEKFGIVLSYGGRKLTSNFIYISEDTTDIPDEGYYLFINRNEVNIFGSRTGIFYALQTLFQLIHFPEDPERRDLDTNVVTLTRHPFYPQYSIPSCSIIDQPRFAWRGMHLDVSRHFYGKEQVKEYLRWMALYKMNVFHWHLTDDQGWRIEIKKYPKLTSVGAWRKGTLIGHEGMDNPPRYDTVTHGGYYTQEEIKEIVTFAASLHITVVPEIEMPGHASAMLAAYPEYGCTDATEFINSKHEVERTWGVFNDVLCPDEKTLQFLSDILKEVAAIFPGKYIHIGGDECPKAEWKSSAVCQSIMKNNSLKTEEELQSWFTKRIVQILKKYGKETMGWDEILEGGLADGAAVMSWRGEDGGIAAAKAKHNVVMSPGGWCYFDHYQSQDPNEPLAIGGYLPLDKVYRYDPVPASLSLAERKYILGVQANVWTEYIGNWNYLQYMVFPRICALSEVAWSLAEEKDYAFFEDRLLLHFRLLDRLDINYARSIFDIESKVITNSFGGVSLEFNSRMKNAKIMYRIDGSDSLYLYDYPITINKPLKITASQFVNGKDSGRERTWSFDYNLATGRPITLRKQPSASYNTGGAFSLVDGLRGRQKPWMGNEWLGFDGDTLDAIIDLGQVMSISLIEVSILHDPGSWIHFPSSYRFYSSTDGKEFSEIERSRTVPEKESLSEIEFAIPVTKARYVRIVCDPVHKIPEGNAGEGHPAWLFISEIEVH